ncbi:hypothetical protein JCM21900_004395 [Sporobolomyces salmonicolor]
MPSPHQEPLLVQIPPATSPLLVPTQHRSDSVSHRHRNSADSFTLSAYPNQRNPDIPDDLEFLAPGQWDESNGQFTEDEEGDSDDGRLDGDDSDVEDWTLEEGHIEGVPCANLRLDAKQYQTTDFLSQLFHLLRHDLAIPGWSTLPLDTPPTLIQVHKVSGSLTNAVFFISVPETTLELEDFAPLDQGSTHTPVPAADSTPMLVSRPRMAPATVFSELERGRQAAATPTPTAISRSDTSTPSPSAPSTPVNHQRPLPFFDGNNLAPSTSLPPHPSSPETITFSAPTLLLRIYGPSSGSLISRRTELHILHTLSSQYAIGPRVLGTFSNGRVEEYFHSRALVKEEMRDPRMSRWIGRRMRELHGVELEQMIPPEKQDEPRRGRNRTSPASSDSRATSQDLERPGIDPLAGSGRNGSSGASIYSTSSSSSIFSFGTSSSSSYSSYSSSSVASGSTVGSSIYGTPRSVVASPSLLPQRPASESRAESKKRPRRKIGSSRGPKAKDRLCVWENITRWTREAKLVLNELDQLAQIPGFDKLLDTPSKTLNSVGPSVLSPSPAASPAPSPSLSAADSLSSPSSSHIPPLTSPSRTLNLRAALNLPLFEQQLRLYRAFVHLAERTSGRSKRVFAHNDTQYGNLLLLTPAEEEEQSEEELERVARRQGGSHKRIIVVDFEYAGANPRGFDIANHFCEWQADYHHPSLSHSLSAHQPYPTASEKIRFLRAYVGCDAGYDGPDDLNQAPLTPGGREDPRVERLLEEVRVWEPSSHAMWAVWGIVQAKEDLLARIEGWKTKAAKKAQGAGPGSSRETETLPAAAAAGVDGLADRMRELEVGPEDIDQMLDMDELDEVGEVFDYLSYAAERMDMFRRELKALGVI